MALGTVLSEGSSGEGVIHFASIRIRVNGSGLLKMVVYSLDDIKSKTLVPFTMEPLARYPPTRIVNFMETRASFELKTTNINEKFRINRIVVFAKGVFTSYPGS